MVGWFEFWNAPCQPSWVSMVWSSSAMRLSCVLGGEEPSGDDFLPWEIETIDVKDGRSSSGFPCFKKCRGSPLKEKPRVLKPSRPAGAGIRDASAKG